MKELYLANPRELQLRDVAAPPSPLPGEVKIKVIYAGICGSDLRVYNGSLSYAKYPLRPGHEVLGDIMEAGAESGRVVGERVVVFPNTFCGTCEFCQSGQTNICKSKKSFGVSAEGVFAEEIVIEAKYAIPVPDGLKNERAILVEPFAVTVHALKKAKIHAGMSVAVVGCGTEGLLAVALALKLGGRLTVIDVNPAKLAIARSIGKVETMGPTVATGRTFDVVIEAAGVKAAIEQALQLVKPGGMMLALGITGEPVTMIPLHLVRNEIKLQGTIIYTVADFADAMQYLGDPELNVEPVLSRFVPLNQFQSAFADALSGNFAKLVLVF